MIGNSKIIDYPLLIRLGLQRLLIMCYGRTEILGFTIKVAVPQQLIDLVLFEGRRI